MRTNKLNLSQILIFFLIFCNLFFGWGFQIFSISGIPINYIFLLLLLLTTKFSNLFHILNAKKVSSILFFFILFNSLRLIYDFQNYGIIAFRDATYFIDILYLLIAVNIFSNKIFLINFINFLKICFVTVIIYVFLWFFRNEVISISPNVQSPLGQNTSLFFNWSTMAFFLIWFSFYKVIFSDHNNKFLNYFFLIFFVLFSIIVFQRRFIYLCLISLFLISFFFRRDETIKISAYFFLGLLILPVLNYIGISLEGKVGRVTDMFFFFDHLASAIPGYDGVNNKFEVTSNTAQKRIEFWSYVLKNQFSNLYTIFFGNGFGSPLVNFIAIGEVTVREPHNMYLTIFSRSGLVGFLFFIIMNLKLINIWFEVFNILKKNKNSIHFKILIFSGIYFVLIYVSGLVDSNLSYNYFSIIFNILWGGIISLNYICTNANSQKNKINN
jgi:hypothetical protein